MLRTLALAAMFAATLAQPVYAIDEARYLNGFDGVACEDDQTKRDMEAIWKTLRWDSRPPLGKNIRVTQSKTTGRSATGLVCQVKIREGGTKKSGVFRLNLFSGGRWNLNVTINN